MKYSLATYIELTSLSENFRGFSFKLLKQKMDLKEIQKYAEDHLPKLGSGSARTVFGLGSGKILKVANHTSDYVIDQNIAEISVHTENNAQIFLLKIFEATKAGFSDLTRYGHWGITADGRVVAADYGIEQSSDYK